LLPAVAVYESEGMIMPPAEQGKTMPHPRPSPGEYVRAQPWSFVGPAFLFGLAAGLLWRSKALRKALRIYLLVRRFV
jgi:hypothetical protein